MEQTSLPFGIPPIKKLTPAMVYTLKLHRKFRKDMEYDEATHIIKQIAEAHEPRGSINLVEAMAKYKREKREMEERIKQRQQ